MFELLPGTGLVLPRQAGVLKFGMTEQAAQWVVASLADVRETWVCQAGWAFTAACDGVELLAYGDCADREGRTERDRSGLAAVALLRGRHDPTGPSAVPVVLDGIDIFGYPVAEVLEVLAPADYLGVRFPAVSPGTYLAEVSVSCLAFGGGAPARA
ncbi:hypothetical protein [Kitasatospora herbaricolor]|uniref:Uncharacterized protein n=1 Tax=Kitasatospora herbaricolor TaxID=68217 RepID=A0ABZ1W233_9ACTN|nr:hypothetical protein [Kitasatospora herbaricolor]